MVSERIERILNTSHNKEADIRGLFEGIGTHLPVIPLKILTGSKLIRGAINWVPAHFTTISQLSYKPASFNKDYQRASIPGKTMFYSCPFTHSKTFENGVFIPRITSMMEIRSLMTKVDVDGVERITFSRWDTKRDIKVFALPFLGNYKKPSDEVLYIQEQWEKNIDVKGTFTAESIELVEYLSYDISKQKSDSCGYMFTAIFIDWYLEHHPEYEGIFYPSVQTEGEGANIAFLPSVVDNREVTFVEASECWLIKRGKESKMITAFKLEEDAGNLTPKQVDFYGRLMYLTHDFPLQGLQFLN